jgi:carboxyl-terminal processing protease
MKLSLPKIRLYAIITLLIFLAFVAGWKSCEKFVLPKASLTKSVNLHNLDFPLFSQVWDRLEAEYFDKTKLDHKKMLYGAVKGMVEAIGDPYTVFLPPSEQRRTQEDLSGSFEGVGIEIGFRGSNLVVISPLDGSPAQKAGIKAGDFIIGIKDEKKGINRATLGMNIIEAVDAIRGPSGTDVTLIISRNDTEKLEITVKRAKIDVPSVKLEFVGHDKKIARLRLLRFGGNTMSEWNQAVSQIKENRVKGIILDLRNNPGGYLPGAIDVASEFLPRGKVLIEERGDGIKTERRVTGAGRLFNEPLVVLVNGGSASASEIVAAAIQENKRGKILGEKTFGKGTIQEAKMLDPISNVDGQAGLHITVAKWLTPSGNWLDQKGLEPDFEVKDDPKTNVDEQLQKALEFLEK